MITTEQGEVKMSVSIKEFDAMLRKQDWFYSFCDDSKAYRAGLEAEQKLEGESKQSSAHERLFKAYQRTRGAGAVEGYESDFAFLSAVRIAVGATTQAELDAIAQEKRDREAQLEAMRVQKLVEYDQVCANHDWYYWRHRIDSDVYQHGFEQRHFLRVWLPLWTPDAYTELFFAWARHRRDELTYDELNAVRQNLGVLK